ncbi:hypothetical protein F6S08_06730 [Pseudomonas sp. JV449]|nr:hypothetical protein [Pseudomonas sp. JV449]
MADGSDDPGEYLGTLPYLTRLGQKMWERACPNASHLRLFVGASLLAKNSQAPRSFRKHALSLTFFASKLAPTGGDVRLTD